MKRCLLLLLPLLCCSFGAGYDPLPPPEYAVIAPAVSTYPLAPPLKKMERTGSFGWRQDPFGGGVEFHRGLDLKAEEGEKISAVLDGRVIEAAFGETYGYYLKIDHYNGFVSLYAHCSDLLAEVGEEVEAGQVIALSGGTGRTTGPHLHLELRTDGKLLDPTLFWRVL